MLSPTPVININEDIPVERFLSRHSRWLKMRAVIHVASFVLDLFANPVALLFFAWPLVSLIWLSIMDEIAKAGMTSALLAL